MESDNQETIRRNARKAGHTVGYHMPDYQFGEVDTGDPDHDRSYNQGFQDGFNEGKAKKVNEV